MRHRIMWGGTAVALALSLAVPAGAGAAPGGNGNGAGGKAPKPTSPTTSTTLLESCQDGATCTHEATALSDGTQTVATSAERSELTTIESERADAFASLITTVRVAEATPKLEVAITWRVAEATGTAEHRSLEGATVARAFLDERFTGCRDCVIEDATRGGYGLPLVDAFSSPTHFSAPITTDTAVPGTYTHRVVVRGPRGGAVPVGTYGVRGVLHGLSYLGCYRENGECTEEEQLGHAGRSTLRVQARVESIVVTPG
jgi:hypothetical protein